MKEAFCNQGSVLPGSVFATKEVSSVKEGLPRSVAEGRYQRIDALPTDAKRYMVLADAVRDKFLQRESKIMFRAEQGNLLQDLATRQDQTEYNALMDFLTWQSKQIAIEGERTCPRKGVIFERKKVTA